jgi:ssDNA-binding Zn-finger/Zn-ribbon topoisomerase 1
MIDPATRQKIVSLAEKEPVRKCPICKIGEMAIRIRRADGEPYWACNRTPACTHRQPVSPAFKLRLAGQPTLFD